MPKRFLFALLGMVCGLCLVCSVIGTSRYFDWPAFGGSSLVRRYLPEPYQVDNAYHYTYRNFMDTWELYRFQTTPEGIAYLADSLNLDTPSTVYEFTMIISRPPPYWWHPEQLPLAELYHGKERAPDGHLYELLYSAETGIAYLIRFDG